LKLVADAHRLSRVQRNCLFRSIVVDDTASRRRNKVLFSIAGRPLGLDWYNVLITVESYLCGRLVFMADDGVIRDASAMHGSYRENQITDRAVTAIVDTLGRLLPARVDAWLDAPVAWSGQMAEKLRGRLAVLTCPSSVDLAPSADYPLKSYPGVIATSDSVLLDAAKEIFDLAARVLEMGFGFIPLPAPAQFPSSAEAPPQ
jgi:hypothetical protein